MNQAIIRSIAGSLTPPVPPPSPSKPCMGRFSPGTSNVPCRTTCLYTSSAQRWCCRPARHAAGWPRATAAASSSSGVTDPQNVTTPSPNTTTRPNTRAPAGSPPRSATTSRNAPPDTASLALVSNPAALSSSRSNRNSAPRRAVMAGVGAPRLRAKRSIAVDPLTDGCEYIRSADNSAASAIMHSLRCSGMPSAPNRGKNARTSASPAGRDTNCIAACNNPCNSAAQSGTTSRERGILDTPAAMACLTPAGQVGHAAKRCSPTTPPDTAP